MEEFVPDIEFSKKIIHAIEDKTTYYNIEILPKVLDSYRLIHSCVKSLMDVLIQRSLIKPDPYKLEKKISGVELISNEPFTDAERSLVIGTRISDYECILDYICTYNKFSVDNLSFAKIKKFVDFNSTFNWNSFNEASAFPNTRGLATLINDAKRGASSIAVNTINDIIQKCSTTTKLINATLKDLNEFQKEAYKAYIRKDIFEHPKFNIEKASKSITDEQAEIKRIFPIAMAKQNYYPSLIEEIAKEDLSPEKATLQENLLRKLVIEKKDTTKKVKQIDSKTILLTSTLALSGLAPQLEAIINKISENKIILQSENLSFFEKLSQKLRKLFNIPEPPVIYTITITEPSTGASTKEKIDIQEFIALIQKKIIFYNSFSVRQSPGFVKIEQSPADKILEFINKQIAEAQKLITQFIAIDNYFKTTATPETRQHIKGLKIEITSLKNTIISTNQHRVDYISFIEEQEQMKKLGITNE